MIKNILLRILISLPLFATSVGAQDGVDAIEKARQAKEAADKAAAEAAAATEAAIEAAAAKAAKAARADAKKKKEEDEARKIAEAQAAEEAELDAAASAAAEEAKRKMAAELGLEVNNPETATDETVNAETQVAEEVVAKESSGYNIGFSGSAGFVKGAFFDNVPTGGSIVLTTPMGFNLGSLQFVVSATVGAYPATHSSGEEFTPIALGLGGNLTLSNLVFAEGHFGQVGEGMGMRGFAGVSLERFMKNGLNLPFNILVGGEGFFSTKMKTGLGLLNDDGTTDDSPSYWGGLALRLDYDL